MSTSTATLAFTSTIESEVNISSSENFFESFTAAPTDHTISVYCDLNSVLAGVPLPYARTDVDSNGNVDADQTRYGYGPEIKNAVYAAFVTGLKTRWAGMADLGDATENNFHYEQVRYALEHLFDAGDQNQLVGSNDTNSDTNVSRIVRLNNIKVSRWITAYDNQAGKYSQASAPGPAPKKYDSNSGWVEDTNVTWFDAVMTDPIVNNYLDSNDTNNSYGDNVFTEDQLYELLDAASDAGKFRLHQLPFNGDYYTSRTLHLNDGESFAVRVKVIQQMAENELNVAHWLVKIVQRSDNAVGDTGLVIVNSFDLLPPTLMDLLDVNFVDNLNTVVDASDEPTLADNDTNWGGTNPDQDVDTNQNT